MGFPKGYTVQCYPKQEQKTQAWQDERMTLIGNSWNVFVVAWLLSQLSLVLGVGPRLTLREILATSFHASSSYCNPDRCRCGPRAEDCWLTSLKGEDVLLQSLSEDPVRYHRLRAGFFRDGCVTANFP